MGISSSDVPGLVVAKDLHAVGGRRGTGLRARLEAGIPIDAQTDERADLAPEFLGLFLAQVAECMTSMLTGGVLVDGQRVDHAHGVALAELLKLLDDLSVEVRVVEPDNDELYRPDGHLVLL